MADFYGEWADGPDPDSLRAIDPDSKARRAVTEAFTAYRLAIEKVGKYDMDALVRRDAAHKAYWKSSNDKALLKAFEDAEAEWAAAYQSWLTKMVRCLLEPQAAAPAPVVAESLSNGSAKPMQRSAAQDAEILAAIRNAGHDPLALPMNEPGKPGVKAAIRDTLGGKGLFAGTTVFDKAWERLRQQCDIADKA